LIHVPSGCAFHPRCPNIIQRCPQEVPPLYPGEPEVRYACFNPVRQ
jgi:oligopeptide transport system ATP-binding protein